MADLNDRCPSGINGLDELMEGGFPRGRTILVSGSCGTGKSTFGIQFLYNGIVMHNEPGILVTMEQTAEDLKKDMLKLGFDIEGEEKSGNLIILDRKRVIPEVDGLSDIVTDSMAKIKPKRMVIDSLGAINFLMGEGEKIRSELLTLSERIKNAGITTVLVSERQEGEEAISAHGIESYILDGVVILTIHPALDTRKMEIRKMRGTKHTLRMLDFDFTENGIEIVGGSGPKEGHKKVII
ncbi:MAG: hypothetical protein L6243_04175 [Candidatus Altiarchaeales archaeon]|nr:ATPase [Candidatus Altiarchaeota archaeon]MCG2782766.1 hypothetical protein [Candidatus Altiarchaeales archaeon]